VAYEDRTEAVDRKLDRHRPVPRDRQPRLPEPLGAPRGKGPRAVAPLDHFAIGVAAHHLRAPRDEKVDDLSRPRPVRGIACDDDPVDTFPVDLGEDRL
jgi:hypothetical protein